MVSKGRLSKTSGVGVNRLDHLRRIPDALYDRYPSLQVSIRLQSAWRGVLPRFLNRKKCIFLEVLHPPLSIFLCNTHSAYEFKRILREETSFAI